MSHYDDVISAINQGEVVPFLGAGVNLFGREEQDEYAPGQYLPSGRELATYLAGTYRYPRLWLGERAEADRTFEESIKLYEERNDYSGEGSALQLIAGNYLVFVRDKGIEFYLRAVNNFRMHQMTDEAWPLFQLGTIYKQEALSQRSETARVKSAEYFTRAHEIFHQTGNTYYEGLVLSELAALYRDQDPSKAIEFYEKAAAVYMAKQGFAQDAAFRLNAISEIYAAQGNQAKAEEYKQRAKSVANPPPAPPR